MYGLVVYADSLYDIISTVLAPKLQTLTQWTYPTLLHPYHSLH